MNDQRMLGEMDRWITGNYGQDRFDNWLDEPEDDYEPFGGYFKKSEEEDDA